MPPGRCTRFTFSYADLVAATEGALYGPYGYQEITDNLAQLMIATKPPAAVASAAGTKAAAAPRAAATRALARNLKAQKAKAARPAFDFPYDNSAEAFSSVLCTDGLNPTNAGAWPAVDVGLVALCKLHLDRPRHGRIPGAVHS